jgi:hypothetical protein
VFRHTGAPNRFEEAVEGRIRVLVVTSTPGARPDRETLHKAADTGRVGHWPTDRHGERDCVAPPVSLGPHLLHEGLG